VLFFCLSVCYFLVFFRSFCYFSVFFPVASPPLEIFLPTYLYVFTYYRYFETNYKVSGVNLFGIRSKEFSFYRYCSLVNMFYFTVI